jgi:3-deoxy-D-manno-octulosonate 8-phosphate phosphatase (KDO 8-P phosphatase)
MIKLIIMDVDGVLTDGKIVYDADGKEIKSFNVKDGLGIKLAKISDIKTAIISGRESAVTAFRANELKIDYIFQGVEDKLSVFNDLLEKLKLKVSETAYIGDDLNDFKLLKSVGFSAAVADAVEEVKNIADVVLNSNGGEGAIREFIEIILKRNGQWKNIINIFTL